MPRICVCFILPLVAALSLLLCGCGSAYVREHPELPSAVKEAISSGNVIPGMTKEQAIASQPWEAQ